MLLEVDPQILRARRQRLGLSQSALARLAETDVERVRSSEKRFGGSVSTYRIINEALDAAETKAHALIAQPEAIAA